jgi:signal transduction histidine kinase
MAALLHNIAAKFEPQARQLQVNLNVEIGALPGFIGDSDRLAQVFTNLVDNAIQYTPAGEAVTLRASQAGDQVEVSVTDRGPGIPPADLQRIFERFYQVDKARRGGGQRGLGLGLAIAYEIVQAHGGTITAHNNPQQGSTFVVKLPVARPDDSTLARRTRRNS